MFFVPGITGQVGGATARALLGKGQKPVAGRVTPAEVFQKARKAQAGQ